VDYGEERHEANRNYKHQDNQQITAIFGAMMDGNILPPQLVYANKTTKCLPKVDFPKDWDCTFTENHWYNETVMIEHVLEILLPYIRGNNFLSTLHW